MSRTINDKNVPSYVYVRSFNSGRDCEMSEQEGAVSVQILDGTRDITEEEKNYSVEGDEANCIVINVAHADDKPISENSPDNFHDTSSKRIRLSNSSVAKTSDSDSYSRLVVNIESAGEKNNTTDDYRPARRYHAKRSPQDAEKRQLKCKVFRDDWLNIDIFRDWLCRDPTDPRKARCLACKTTMNAGKSELEKHATGFRHERNLVAMLQQRFYSSDPPVAKTIDWLGLHPTDSREAYCLICKTPVNLEKIGFEKHISGNGHKQAMEAEHGSRSLLHDSTTTVKLSVEPNEGISGGDDYSLPESSNSENPDFDRDVAEPSVIEHAVRPERPMDHVEVFMPPEPVGCRCSDALNRLEHTVENLSANINVLLERLATQQESFDQLVKFIHDKLK